MLWVMKCKPSVFVYEAVQQPQDAGLHRDFKRLAHHRYKELLRDHALYYPVSPIVRSASRNTLMAALNMVLIIAHL